MERIPFRAQTARGQKQSRDRMSELLARPIQEAWPGSPVTADALLRMESGSDTRAPLAAAAA